MPRPTVYSKPKTLFYNTTTACKHKIIQTLNDTHFSDGLNATANISWQLDQSNQDRPAQSINSLGLGWWKGKKNIIFFMILENNNICACCIL